MDPNKILNELRKRLSTEFIESIGNDEVKLAIAYGHVTGLFELLDQWLKLGGFLPDEWKSAGTR
jgi:hypothetical protein